MINRTQWRSYLLGISGIGINLAMVYSFIFAAAGNRQAAEFKFPRSFAAARAVSTAKNITQGDRPEIIKANQQYQYTQDGLAIALEINYLVGTRGDVATYLQDYTDLDAEVIKAKSIAQIKGIGHHALLKDSQRIYLTSCISPRSLSNVTQKQFSQYRYENDLNWQTGWQWLQGKASIRDRRCLWILLATPITHDSIRADYQVLETAWKDIYQWWLPNFPDLVSRN